MQTKQETNKELLLEASNTGDIETVKRLLEDTELDARILAICLSTAVKANHVNLVEVLLKDSRVDEEAVYEILFEISLLIPTDNEKTVAVLLTFPLSINHKYELFQCFISRCNQKIAKLFLTDPHIGDEVWNCAVDQVIRFTPFVTGAWVAKLNVLNMLLEKASITKTNKDNIVQEITKVQQSISEAMSKTFLKKFSFLLSLCYEKNEPTPVNITSLP